MEIEQLMLKLIVHKLAGSFNQCSQCSTQHLS